MLRNVCVQRPRAPTHVFEAVYGADGQLLSGEDVEPRLLEWMREWHRQSADDSRFRPEPLAAWEREHRDWERNSRAPEMARSRAAAADGQRWQRFRAEAETAMNSGHWDSDRHDHETWAAFLAHAVTAAAVLQAIRLGGRHVATSPADRVSYEALRAGGAPLAETLALIFTTLLAAGIVPTAWKEGYVSWLFKRGAEFDCGSYRGVVLTSCIGKVFERVLFDRLLLWVRFRRLVPPEQATANRTGDVL